MTSVGELLRDHKIISVNVDSLSGSVKVTVGATPFKVNVTLALLIL